MKEEELMEKNERITLSVIKADVGGFVGHSGMHPHLIQRAEKLLSQEKERLLVDYRVSRVGDDLELIMTHRRGADNPEIHSLAYSVFKECAELAKEKKLYGAGQDLLKDSFSGNIKGMGPGVAEIEMLERKSEPVIVFMADKTSPGAWNMPIYKIFADPFNTIGLVIDPSMHKGFIFEVHDLQENKMVEFSCPEDLYDMLALIGNTSRFLVKSVRPKNSSEYAAVTTTQKLNLIAGRYVGKDDPVMIVRCQSGLPAVGEALEPFSFPHLVPGWMRGSHNGPLMPVSVHRSNTVRFDGPPRVVALGFQIANGYLHGPVDLFDDYSFDEARSLANHMASVMRRHGPFEPHLLSSQEMEYTTLPFVKEKLKERFEPIPDHVSTDKIIEKVTMEKVGVN